jgi:hypothetical protein
VSASVRPGLAAVLAAVTPGRTARLNLTELQKRSLGDSDGQLALDVLRHLLGARAAAAGETAPPIAFPLTEATFQAIARRRGRAVGIKRIRALLRRLVVVGVIEPTGSYRQAYRNSAGSSGYRVVLYTTGPGVLKAIVGTLAGRSARLRFQRPVGNVRAVKAYKRRRWWQHELFGTLDGRPPPGLTAKQRQRLHSADELEYTWR